MIRLLCAGLAAFFTLACQDGYTSLGRQASADTAFNSDSGLPWASGTNAQNLARLTSWASFRGRPNDVVIVLPDYSSWTSLTQPDTLVEEFASFPGMLVLGLPLWSYEGGSLVACAAGDYDSSWANLGTSLLRHDRGTSVARVGWQSTTNRR